MKVVSVAFAATLFSLQTVQAAVPLWGQCGGVVYTGDVTCTSGAICQKWNDWFSQCIPGPTSTSSIRSSTSTLKSTSTSKTSSTTSVSRTTVTSSSTVSRTTVTSTSTVSRTSTTVSSSASATPTLAPLHDLAKAAGKQYFGVAVDTNELANATYKVLLDNTHLFGQITPGNKMKWDATEPSQGTFTFSAADALVTWAQGNGYQIRGHTLVWHSQLPSWVTSGAFSNATLVSILGNHVTNLVTHFKGSVKTWDVVNEIFNEDGTFRTSVFYTTIGETYVDIAFRAAAAADPDVGLAANDYNLDYGGAKMQAYVTLVNTLKSRGVKITQIGSQSHLIVGSTPSQSSLANVFATLAATGVEVAVTELDIRMTLPVTDALLAQQKKDYYNVVAACVQTSGCIGVTIWAYSDYYSWIPSVFSGQGAALPFDEYLQPKPAFYGIAEALTGTTTTTSSTTSISTSTTSVISSTSTSSSSSTSASATPTLAPLNDLAKAAGKQYFGVAVDSHELANATYRVLLDNTHLFGQITPGNKMKWDATEPSRGTFTFSAADALVTWAQGNGYEIRGHTLVWHSQLPSWVSSGGFDNATLVSILENHVTNLVTHFKGSIKTWDVVNEIFNEDGTFRTSVFYTTIGEYYVDIAFRAAAAADPNVRLAANDYNLDYGGAKMQAYVTLVNTLKSRGVKITQIGSQSHLIVGSTPSQNSLANVFATLAATGVEVAVTELDIRMTLPVTDALLAQQKKDYYNVVAACVQTSGCIGVTIWAYSDYYSWIPSVFSGQGAALPFDEYLQPKPAFYGIAEALTGTTISTSSTISISTTPTSTISSTSITTSASASASATLAPLNDLAKADGKQYFGVAVDSVALANTTHRVLLDNTHLFGQMTPGNEMKWDATEPSRGTFTYTAANALVVWANGNGYQIRGHTLVWHSQLPSWVTAGAFNNETLVSILDNHVTNVVTYFNGNITTWDVVNEIFNEDGTFRTSVFYTTIGEWYVDIAFRAAAAANPNVGLAANDYNIDYGGAKATAYVTLVNTLKSRGVKITQVGSQSHLIVGSVPSQSSLAATFAKIIATGVDLTITELDIRMTLPATDALLAQQKKDYNAVIGACVQTTGCIGMTIWGHSDYYSWIPSVFSGQGSALPFDEYLQPKPAFYGIADALNHIVD